MSHVYQLPSGTWRVIVKSDGRTRTGTAPTKREVKRLGAELLIEMGATPRRDAATVADLIAHYCAVRANDWSPTYRADIDLTLDRIPDSFADLRANTITPGTIARLYRKLTTDGWPRHRLRRLHEILSAAWRLASEEEMVSGDSPISKVKKPTRQHRQLTIPTHEQVMALLNAPDHPRDRLALRLAATLGARRGEIVAFQWRDIDLETSTIYIRRSLSYTPADGIIEGDTKTGESGHRVVDIGPATVEALRAWHDQQASHDRTQGVEQIWVFSDDGGGGSWRPDRLTHIFADARHRAHVEGVRLHDLRHYVATTMLRDGEPAIKVAAQLGHATTTTTLDVYAHYMPTSGRESAERREARWET